MQISHKLFLLFFSTSSLMFGMSPTEIEKRKKNFSPEYPLQAVLACYNPNDFIDKPKPLDPALVQLSFEGAPQKIKGLIKLLSNREMFQHYKPKDLLLKGDYGIGKRTLAQTIALKSDLPFICVDATSLGNQFKKSGEENILRLIDLALQEKAQPSIIILNSIFLCYQELSKDGELASLWQTLERYRSNKKIYLITITETTSHDIFFPLEEKFDVVTITPPNAEAREKALIHKISTHHERVVINCTTPIIKELALRATGFNFHELKTLYGEALNCAVKNELSIRDTKKFDNQSIIIVTDEDFEKALTQIQKRVQEFESSHKSYLERMQNYTTDAAASLFLFSIDL